MSFNGGHKCQNLKSVNGSHQYNMAIELQIVLLCLNLKQEYLLSDIREVLIAYKLYDSSSFCLIACSCPCSIKAPSLNTVSNVTNLMAGMIYFLSHAFYRRMEGAVNTLELFPILLPFLCCSRFLLGKANKRYRFLRLNLFQQLMWRNESGAADQRGW